jgi:hypothetical protein
LSGYAIEDGPRLAESALAALMWEANRPIVLPDATGLLGEACTSVRIRSTSVGIVVQRLCLATLS